VGGLDAYAGRAVEPLEARLAEEAGQAPLAHADETPWKEWGKLLWLWVISTATVSLYLIGYRSAELITNALGEDFAGWLMTDGYRVYRQFQKRLRCWAHLLRKAKGLQESLTGEAKRFGDECHALLEELMAAVYQAREGPPTLLADRYRDRLEAFRLLCELHWDSPHEKTRALAREFLNDREAIWIVLSNIIPPCATITRRRLSSGEHPMTLAETIQTHVQALPPTLQRETLDFIAWLETRYGIAAPSLPAFPLSETEAFLQRHADALSEDFPDDIDDSDLGADVPRNPLE